jgi:hypothetical protein
MIFGRRIREFSLRGSAAGYAAFAGNRRHQPSVVPNRRAWRLPGLYPVIPQVGLTHAGSHHPDDGIRRPDDC